MFSPKKAGLDFSEVEAQVAEPGITAGDAQQR